MSTSLNILTVDFGTSSAKAALIDQSGHVLWYFHDSLLLNSRQLMDWEAHWWEESLKRIVSNFARSGLEADALVMSGNGPSLVAVDHLGETLSPSLLWIDDRRRALADTKSYYLPKIAWFAQEHALGYKNVRHFLSLPEYLYYKLSGQAVMIGPSAAFNDYIWNDQEIKKYEIDKNLLPPFVSPGALIGTVSKAAAKSFGLKAGLKLLAGGSDFLMSLIGTNTLSAGKTCDRAGSSEGINHCSSLALSSDKLRTLPHISEGLFNVSGVLGSTGLMFEWFRRISGKTETSYFAMLEAIQALPPEGNYPYFFPNHHKNAAWDFSKAMFINLATAHVWEDLGRAVVESIAFSVRKKLEHMRAAGCTLSQLRLCGGQAKNMAWNQLKADICGMELWVPVIKDAELCGNAILGLCGLGHFKDFYEGAEALVRQEAIIEPDAQRYKIFGQRYDEYCSRELAVSSLFS